MCRWQLISIFGCGRAPSTPRLTDGLCNLIPKRSKHCLPVSSPPGEGRFIAQHERAAGLIRRHRMRLRDRRDILRDVEQNSPSRLPKNAGGPKGLPSTSIHETQDAPGMSS